MQSLSSILRKHWGLDSGILDSTNGSENATEGSAVSAVFAVKSGDISPTISSGGDYLPYDDFAFVSVNGKTETFSIGEVGSYGTEAGVFKPEITDEDINDDEPIAVSVGVMDVGDTAMDTSLVVKDLALNKEEYINDDVDIDDDFRWSKMTARIRLMLSVIIHSLMMVILTSSLQVPTPNPNSLWSQPWS